ncbi:Hypothetical protein LOCK900_2072 [Lacticaseibacillus rhamnosus LOCK900]|nr:Hypothetical protein LOCK900_2072 [Lacticaseibacillus rhamnosus LOCK900]
MAKDRAIALKAAYTPTSNRAGSRSHKNGHPPWDSRFFDLSSVKSFYC